MTGEDQDLGPWALFLGGKWQKTRPVRAGVYPVASREGAPMCMSKAKLVDEAGKQVGVPHGEPGWLGWWWSSPLPTMPRAAGDW